METGEWPSLPGSLEGGIGLGEECRQMEGGTEQASGRMDWAQYIDEIGSDAPHPPRCALARGAT